MVVAIRKIASKQEVVKRLHGLTNVELRKLERIARIRVIGLCEIEWQDLLNEAIVRMLDGSRQWPKDVDLVVFLRQTMRSIASDHWRRRKVNPVISESQLHEPSEEVEGTLLEVAIDPTANPERDVVAAETIAQIRRAFEGDLEALHVLSGMAIGKSPREIQDEGNMDARRYATTQKRIRRRLAKAFPDKRVKQ